MSETVTFYKVVETYGDGHQLPGQVQGRTGSRKDQPVGEKGAEQMSETNEGTADIVERLRSRKMDGSLTLSIAEAADAIELLRFDLAAAQSARARAESERDAARAALREAILALEETIEARKRARLCVPGGGSMHEAATLARWRAAAGVAEPAPATAKEVGP